MVALKKHPVSLKDSVGFLHQHLLCFITSSLSMSPSREMQDAGRLLSLIALTPGPRINVAFKIIRTRAR